MGKISLSNIIEGVATRSGLSREASDNFMHAFVETIEKGLQEDGIVKIKGLGTFKLQEVNDRGSVDVNTGERIVIKGYRRVTFTPDSAMKEFINRPFAHFEPTELNDGYPLEEETIEQDNSSDENEEPEIAVVEEPAEEIVTNVTEEEVGNTVPEVIDETIENTGDIVGKTIVAEEEVEAIPAIEERLPEIEETAEETAEDIVGEPVEETGEVATEEATEEKTEKAEESIESTEQPDPITEETHQPKPRRRKRRGGCLWLILLLLIAFAAYFLCTHGIVFDEPVSKSEVDEQADITVKSNLEEELKAEFGDESKAETQPEKKEEEVKPIATEPKPEAPAIGQSPQADTVEKVQSKVTESPAPQTVEPSKPTAPIFLEVKLTESLASKPLKNITLADTTDYTIEGTLVTHELKSGETIIQLAKKYYGEKCLWPYIVKHNQMKDYNNLAIGQKINIPILK